MPYLFWILGFVLGLVGLLVLICIPHNLRVWRVRRVYRSLPADIVEPVLQLIEQAAALEAKRPPNPCILLKPVQLPAEKGEEGTFPMLPERL